jgi:hypothetical protein
MIPVKVQCDCGQRYAFEVEPVNSRMPTPVTCPVCGADGTAAANEVIAQKLAQAPLAHGALRVAAAPATSSVSAPAPPVALARPAQPAPARPATTPPARPALAQPTRGKDGWATPETGLNKLGTYIVVTPAGLSGLLSWGLFGLEVPALLLGIVSGICGMVGGALNVAGRGPIAAGAFIGLVMSLGGYGAVYWWIQGRHSVRVFELAIAFVVGALPGFVLQAVLQQILRKRARAAG